MIARCRLAGLAVALPALLAAALAPPSPARAGDGLEPYAPLLVELPGWKAGKLGGLAMQDGGSRIVVVQRGYERGEVHVSVQLLAGQPAQSRLASAGTGLNTEASHGPIRSATIDGFKVTQTFKPSDKSGTILVALGPTAALSLAFKGLGDDEALATAKTFDWKAMQAAVK
ncbi:MULTISPECIES: hypothetical protein [Rhodopseudomonas]|uniref:Uncharacterized protein n=1 Tax=Rhodopseudomonas palustris TaxID=1076 RepID=A0A0D7EGU1_RHOPL|nr:MULTISPECIES: hypothetical protein [Rhodopseudomonas]KIZ39978.1 hypothetical protein OO17_18885 [Rhodopseudomonas palustris]MDF3813898.1 hypothetical protein [Rhodopseudomonas sp. BAL398]WOK18287.1 hypothetical protein RBJ75_01785 [Rhodopseudomonas sp. BAL398]